MTFIKIINSWKQLRGRSTSMNIAQEELYERVEKACAEANIPGAAVRVTKDGEVVHEQMVGYRDVEKQLPVTAQTVFGVASITKSFATLAIMQLAEKKQLSVHDPVSYWIDGFQASDISGQENITIHHLMTHTAGFPGMEGVHLARMNSVEKDPDGKRLFTLNPDDFNERLHTVDELVEWLDETSYTMIAPPGDMCNYSNEGFALLQAIIEKASGQDVLTYMKKHIFHPLGMDTSTFLIEDLQNVREVTELYAYADGHEKIFEHSPVWWDVGNIYTNGSLKSNAAEITAYAQMYMNDGSYGGKKLLSKESIKQMTTRHVQAPNENAYGYGLQIDKDETVFGHGGAMKGVSSYFLVDKEHQLTIVVLMNIADAPAGDLAKDMHRYFVGDPIKPHQIACPHVEEFAHTFRSNEGHVIRTFTKDDTLYMEGKWNPVELIPIKKDLFMTKGGAQLAFLRTGDSVSGIFSGMRYIPKAYA